LGAFFGELLSSQFDDELELFFQSFGTLLFLKDIQKERQLFGRLFLYWNF
jgi:hypothetical protein